VRKEEVSKKLLANYLLQATSSYQEPDPAV
jgi:hypothetical protein